MIHSNIESIMEKHIGDDEEINASIGNLGGIEREIDNLADRESKKDEPDPDNVICRAMELIKRETPFNFFDSNKSAIESDIRNNLKVLGK